MDERIPRYILTFPPETGMDRVEAAKVVWEAQMRAGEPVMIAWPGVRVHDLITGRSYGYEADPPARPWAIDAVTMLAGFLAGVLLTFWALLFTGHVV